MISHSHLISHHTLFCLLYMNNLFLFPLPSPYHRPSDLLLLPLIIPSTLHILYKLLSILLLSISIATTQKRLPRRMNPPRNKPSSLCRQLIQTRTPRLPPQLHPHHIQLCGQQWALPSIALFATSDGVVPCELSAETSGHDVVEG